MELCKDTESMVVLCSSREQARKLLKQFKNYLPDKFISRKAFIRTYYDSVSVKSLRNIIYGLEIRKAA
jgi:ribosomal protein S17E